MTTRKSKEVRARRRREQRRNQRILIVTGIIVVVALFLIFTKGGSTLFAPETPVAMAFPDLSQLDLVTMDSGLQYYDLVVGTGAEAKANTSISVDYTGWLTDGTKFDSSIDRGAPFQFDLGTRQVILGWDQGVAGMRVGGTRILVIPPEMGYGSREEANGLIPANSVLVFEVTLLEVK